MGGGVKGSVSRFSAYRQIKQASRPIAQTGKDFDLPLDIQYVKTKVVNEKQWNKVYGSEEGDNAAAFVRNDTIYIRRKYFTKLDRGVITHELLHTQAGPKKYNTKLGRIMEEGTVEYLKQYTLTNNYKTRAKKFSKQYYAYDKEVDFVSNLMTIVGPKQFIRYWGKGFKNNNEYLANDLRKKGYENTYKLMTTYSYSILQPNSDKEIYKTLNDEIASVRYKNEFFKKRLAIEHYDKPSE